MSYDLNLYLKSAPVLAPEAFAATLEQLGLTGELAPDFAIDGSVSPLCAKIRGLIPGDDRTYLAVTDYICTTTETDAIFTLPSPRRSIWKRKTEALSLTAPTGSHVLTFSCGMDSLELPFALLVASAIAGEDGLLYDPQEGRLALGSDISLLTKEALDALRSTPEDRLLLHEFEEWI